MSLGNYADSLHMLLDSNVCHKCFNEKGIIQFIKNIEKLRAVIIVLHSKMRGAYKYWLYPTFSTRK